VSRDGRAFSGLTPAPEPSTLLSVRWFTREWQDGELSDEEAEARDPAYAAYVRSIADRLPERLRAFALATEAAMSVHDALVDQADLDIAAGRIELLLLNGDLQAGYGKLRLTFLDAELVEPSVERLRDLLTNRRTEFLRQELELDETLPATPYGIRFLLWPEGQIAIRCRDLQIEWHSIEDNSRSDYRNEVRISA
jgi:hypothetical protein